ncbi:MAG: carbohydrate kinase, YjeF related protein, partial [Ilumatobacteraceae bacterium]|nr:carbohydrate kinase, YjeF related protein [Ilumatobacteraceae bacterium]
MPRAEPAIRLDAGLLARWPLPVDDHGDKHVRGTVLVLGGGPSTLGAVLLAGSAALRMGAGRLQIGVAAPAPAALGVAVPEAMVVELPTHRDGRLRPHRAAAAVRSLIEGADAILVGPGMLAGPATLQFVGDVLAAASPTAIVVLDAAALPAASHTDADTLARVRSRVALTPNRQEAQALVA